MSNDIISVTQKIFFQLTDFAVCAQKKAADRKEGCEPIVPKILGFHKPGEDYVERLSCLCASWLNTTLQDASVKA